jgi:hypothetical protein
VTHAYGRAGLYTVRISQADVLGNATAVAADRGRGAVRRARGVGSPLTAAKAAIGRGHCRTGRVTRAYSRTVRKGRVLAQRLAPGKRLANGASVNLIVSRGRRR